MAVNVRSRSTFQSSILSVTDVGVRKQAQSFPLGSDRRERPTAMSFTFEATLDPVLEDVKAKLQAKAGGVLNAFHAIDKDNSGQLSTAEFVQILKDFGIVLPPRQLRSLIARFDANGDGTVSIPEFSAYMSGNAGAMEALATAEAVADDSPLPPPGSTMPPSAFGRAPRARAPITISIWSGQSAR